MDYLNGSDVWFLQQGAPRVYTNATLWEEAVAEHMRKWRDAPFVNYFYCIAISVLSVSGTIGNVFVIASIFFTGAIRKGHSIFIVNLSVTDSIITGFIMPISVLGTVRGPLFWRGKPGFCDFVGSLCTITCTAAVWNIMSISLERYFCICHLATHYKVHYTRKKTLIMVAGVWITSYLIHMPNIIGWGVTNYASDFYICTGDLRIWSYTVFWAILSVIVPVGVSFYAYLHIYLRVRASQSGRNLIAGKRRVNPDPTKNPGKRSSFMAEELTLIKALFKIFLIFLASWFPLAALFSFRSILHAPNWLNLLALLLAHGNSATNSLIYFWMTDHSTVSRSALRRKLRKICPRLFGALGDNETETSRYSTARFRRGESLYGDTPDSAPEKPVKDFAGTNHS